MSYIHDYLQEVQQIAKAVQHFPLVQAMDELQALKQRRGRLFILGNGGSAANASHAVNDFRKIARIEAYAPTDNVAEFSAWMNDEGRENTFDRWLRESHLKSSDVLLVLSVGGGSSVVSVNLVRAIELAMLRGTRIVSIVGRDDGEAAKIADVCILVPTVNESRITPHTEEWQSIILHLLVNGLANNEP